MNIKKIKVEIYKTSLTVLIEPKRELALKWIEKMNGEAPPINAIGACYTPKVNGPFIWIKNLKNTSILCHEVTHACYGILDSHGVEVTASNHEALTYLQTFILDKILK